MDTWVINSLLGFIIGLMLGFLGGGGSILTVPALVYLVGQSPQAAVSTSLIIVGSNAAVGALIRNRHGRITQARLLNWRVALIFGGVGMLTAYWGADFSQNLSSSTLMILFALLMLVVGSYMLFTRNGQQIESIARGWLVTVASGAGVGLLTGFLGVGGGFLIVPALVMLVGLPIHQAVGTSLVIIAMNSLAGLLGHLTGTLPDLQLIAVFVSTGIIGVLAGTRLGHVIKAEHLRATFAVMILLLAIFLLVDNCSKLM